MAGYRLAPKAARARRNPWQRRRWSVSVTPPAANTKTFTADAIVKAELSKTFTADAIVVIHYEGVAQYPLFGMWAPATQTKTFTADAIVVSGVATTRTATFTADAIVVNPQRTKTFTADALVVGLGLTKTFTADAIVVASLTPTTRIKTFTADAIVATQGLTGRGFLWLRRARGRTMSQVVKKAFVLIPKGTTRTTSYASPTQEAQTEAGIIVTLDVTSASGTGGLTLNINSHDVASSQVVKLNPDPSAVTTTGTYSYALYPFGAISGNVTQATAFYLPRAFSISVTHGDSSSYTYSLGYCLLP